MRHLSRVSVVSTAYNAAAFIDEALASVVAQTRPAHQVIVVDDGSTDDTGARVRAWEGRTGTTRLSLLDGPNRGLSVSRNRGILTASGELVALLDADDRFLPRRLELLVPTFERAPDVVLAFGDMVRFDHGGEDRGSVLGALREEIAHISTPLGDGGLFVAGPARAEWSERQLLRTVAHLLRFGSDHAPEEVAALQRQLGLTLWETGWLASGKGWRAYHQWRREVRPWTGRRAPVQARHLLRVLRSHLHRSLTGG